LIKRRRADLAGNGSPWWLLLSQDKGQKYLYVADGLDEVIWTLERDSGRTLSGFGRLGHMAGEFTFLHTIAMNSKGDLREQEIRSLYELIGTGKRSYFE